MNAQVDHPLSGLVRQDMICMGEVMEPIKSDGTEFTYLDSGLPIAVTRVGRLPNHMSMRGLLPGYNSYLRVDVMVDLRVRDPKAVLKAPILMGIALFNLDAHGNIGSSAFSSDELYLRTVASTNMVAVPENRLKKGVLHEAVRELRDVFKTWNENILGAVMGKMRNTIAAHADIEPVLMARAQKLRERAEGEAKDWVIRAAESAARSVEGNIRHQSELTETLGILSTRLAALTGVPNDGLQRAAQTAARLVEEREEAVLRQAEMSVDLERRREIRELEAVAKRMFESRVQTAAPRLLDLVRDLAAGDALLSERARELLEQTGLQDISNPLDVASENVPKMG